MQKSVVHEPKGAGLSPGEDAVSGEKIYDNVFWTTMVHFLPHVVPMINEAFGQNFGKEARVRLKSTKQVVLLPDNLLRMKEVDALVEVYDPGASDTERDYHFECQTWWDGSVVIQVAQYAVGAAYNSIRPTEKGAEMVIPHTSVILLRGRKNLRKAIMITVKYPGGSIEYEVPILQIRDYDLYEIFEKRLFLLLPFYFF